MPTRFRAERGALEGQGKGGANWPEYHTFAPSMISRRNIRVKVMQTLYTIEATDHSTKAGDEVKILDTHLEQSRQLFVYLVWFLTEVARYAEYDARHRASKHLPSPENRHEVKRVAKMHHSLHGIFRAHQIIHTT